MHKRIVMAYMAVGFVCAVVGCSALQKGYRLCAGWMGGEVCVDHRGVVTNGVPIK